MSATWPNPPPTRLISWAQSVRASDPSFTRLSLQPWVYEFSSGRLFIDPLPLYGNYPTDDGWIDSDGNPMFDDEGNRMRNAT
jgi:hypothetical protein